MSRNEVLRNYSLLGINSQNSLYEFMVDNVEAVIGDTTYNLDNSNEAMEFMAIFLEALGFKVLRLYLEKNNDDTKCHWFLAFYNGFKWYYYEANLNNMVGKYVFSDYKNLVVFALAKIIKSFENLEGINSETIEILEQYSLREITPLNGLNLYENIKQSKNGNEILAWSNADHADDYNKLIKKAEKEEIRNRNSGFSFTFFAIGFVITLSIGVLLVWILAMIYYGKL